ncbi:MAG TPA: glycosyltransferase family 2 protein [Parafilimonas sp.]|nr:glycosyltransferase family 2 protein [Parafilimonas sp.]
MHDLSISVVLYKNKIQQLEHLLNSILKTHLSYKIYFIDNSPSDELKEKLLKLTGEENTEYIFTGRNIGFGSAHNIVLKQVINQNKYHLVLNPDIRFDAGVLEELFKFMESNSQVGNVIPKVLYPDGSIQYVCKLVPTPFNLISRLFPKALLKKYKQDFELRFSGYDKIMNVPYLHGCFMFLRCSALMEIGLFDERFFMYPEDIDLTRRMHRRYQTVFYPYVQICHEHTRSSFKSLRMFVIHLYNLVKYFNKWGWLFDSERKKINEAVLQQLKYNNQLI